jgi:hypothetical protein
VKKPNFSRVANKQVLAIVGVTVLLREKTHERNGLTRAAAAFQSDFAQVYDVEDGSVARRKNCTARALGEADLEFIHGGIATYFGPVVARLGI